MKPLPIEPRTARVRDEAGVPAEELSEPGASPVPGAPPTADLFAQALWDWLDSEPDAMQAVLEEQRRRYDR